MKKLIILASALFITTAATAGNNIPFISLGVKAGITSEKQNLSMTVPSLPSLNNVESSLNNAVTGYHVGLMVRLDIPLLPIYVQPELLYNWGKVKDTTGTLGDIKLNSFNVPVLIGAGVGVGTIIKLRANVGPVFNLTSNAKIGDASWALLEDAFKKPTIGWTAGVGVDLFGLTVDARYNGTFGKQNTSISNLAASINTKPSSWTVSLGYLF